MMKTYNRKIFCDTFERVGVKTSTRNGVRRIDQHTGLAQTEVVVGDDEMPPGTKVWLRGDAAKVLESSRFLFPVEGEKEPRELLVVGKEMVLAFEVPSREAIVEKATVAQMAALPPPVCTGSGQTPPALQGLVMAGSSVDGAACGICGQNVRVDGYQRAVVHPYRLPEG